MANSIWLSPMGSDHGNIQCSTLPHELAACLVGKLWATNKQRVLSCNAVPAVLKSLKFMELVDLIAEFLWFETRLGCRIPSLV